MGAHLIPPKSKSGLDLPEPATITDVRDAMDALLAEQARTLHLHRELRQTLDWGFALLDALDLGPMALDVIDEAIAELDAWDAPDEDLEPSLGTAHFADGYALDAEDDSEEDEGTALETHGRGFVRAGEDDAEEDDEPEDSDPGERDDECGSDDAEDIGHHASQFRPRSLTCSERAEVAVIAARAATLRGTLHV